MQNILLVFVGIAAGLIGGMFGIGGGVVIVPALVLGFLFSQHMAQGTMLATFLLPSFVFAVWTYHKAGHVNWPVAVFLSLGMMIGSVLGAHFAHQIPAAVLKKIFGALMLLLSLKLILGK
jgi:uncharacterized protein